MRLLALLLSLAALAPAAALAQQPTHSVLLYGLGIAIDGQAAVGPITADVNMSASEVFDNLELGAMGSYRWDSDPWAFQLDVMFAALAGDQAGSQGIATATLDLDQTMIGIDAGYQVTKSLELIVGARYWDYQADLRLAVSGPAGVGRSSTGSNSWIDPLLGLRVVAPLGASWTFSARADVGGFGVGSDFAWSATAFFDWRFGNRLSMLLGYRIFDVDFDDRGSSGLRGLDLQQSGPGIGLAFRF